jgi:uncharacterized membrane protein HdeD (DUF308 family)
MKEWIKLLILGAVSLIFGIYVLGNAVAASMAVATITGVLLLIAGGFQFIGGFSVEGLVSKIFALAMGALMLVLGASFVFNPLEGVVSLTLLVLILLAVSGIVRMAFAWQMRETPFFWAMLISGALSVFLAGYILVNFATVGPSVLGILLGIEMVFNGAGLIVMALFVRTVGDKVANLKK